MGTNTYGYVFDPIGNRITATNNAEVTSYAANALNQYTDITNAVVVLPTHDEDGNMTSTGDGWHYAWNGENRLVLGSNATHVVSYAYDHRGRMVLKTLSQTSVPSVKTIRYNWDDFNIIAETVKSDSATNTTYNVWGLDLDGTMQGAGGVGGLLAVISPLPLGEGQGEGSTVYLPCYDANGNISEYVSTDGIIIAHREYGPFGGTVVATGEANAFTHWFSTKPWCAVTGLSEYQFRKYSPVMGGWTSRDTIEENGGLNLYGYVYNNPLGQIDAFGHAGWTPVETGLAAALTGTVASFLTKTLPLCTGPCVKMKECLKCCDSGYIAAFAWGTTSAGMGALACGGYVVPWKIVACGATVDIAYFEFGEALLKAASDCRAKCLTKPAF